MINRWPSMTKTQGTIFQFCHSFCASSTGSLIGGHQHLSSVFHAPSGHQPRKMRNFGAQTSEKLRPSCTKKKYRNFSLKIFGVNLNSTSWTFGWWWFSLSKKKCRSGTFFSLYFWWIGHKAIAPTAVVQLGFAIKGSLTNPSPLISGITNGLSFTNKPTGPNKEWLVGGFNQPHLKNMRTSNWIISSQIGVNMPKIFELPPPGETYICIYIYTYKDIWNHHLGKRTCVYIYIYIYISTQTCHLRIRNMPWNLIPRSFSPTATKNSWIPKFAHRQHPYHPYHPCHNARLMSCQSPVCSLVPQQSSGWNIEPNRSPKKISQVWCKQTNSTSCDVRNET